MQQYRTIRSLQEDLDFLGLGDKKKVGNPIIAAMTEGIGENNSLFHSLNPKIEEEEGTYTPKYSSNVFKTKVFKSNKEANDFMEKNKGWGAIGTEGEDGKPNYKVHVALNADKGQEKVKTEDDNNEYKNIPDHKLNPKNPSEAGILAVRLDDLKALLKDPKIKTNPAKQGEIAVRIDDIEAMLGKKKEVKEDDNEVLNKENEQVFKKVVGKKFGKVMQTSPKSFTAMAMDMENPKGYLLNKEFSTLEAAKEALLKAIGEEVKESKDLNESQSHDCVQTDEDMEAGKEFLKVMESGQENLEEAIKVQKMHRMTAAQRAHERREYRHKRSKIKRAVKKLHKKTAWKRKHKKFQKLKHGRHAGARKRFIMAGIDSMATIAEGLSRGLNGLQEQTLGKEDLLKIFESIDGICNKFNAKVSALFEESPEEKKLGYELNYVGKEWDELDNAEDDDNKDLDNDYDFTEIGDDWDELDDHDEEGDEVDDDDYEDENDKDYVGAEESIMMDMRCMAEDANSIIAKLKDGTIEEANAKEIFIGMVNHIIESSKILTTAMEEEFNYVGQDDVDDEKPQPEKPESNAGKYVGKGGDPKETTQKPEASDSNAGKYVGKGGEPKAETQKPVAPQSNAGKYVDTKGEPEEVKNAPTKVDSNAGKYVGDGKPEEENEKLDQEINPSGKHVGEAPYGKLIDKTVPVIESRSVKVIYDDGSEINTDVNAKLSDDDIRSYFKVGKSFNIGSGDKDKIAKVTKVEICNEDKTPVEVVFKKEDGHVVAVFPNEKNSPSLPVTMYTKEGHVGATKGYVAKLKDASPAEYASLKKELEGKGYVLSIKESESKVKFLSSEYEEDIRQAALSGSHFDNYNAKDIGNSHGEDPKVVLKQIKELRKSMAVKESVENKYVGKDKPSEVNKAPVKPESNKGKYVGTKGEPDEEDEDIKSASMKGKHVGEKQGKTPKEVPVLEAKEDSSEKLSTKLTQIGGLYDIDLAIGGEKNKSSTERLIEYIKMQHGEKAIDELATKSHADLRSALKKFDIIELKKSFKEDKRDPLEKLTPKQSRQRASEKPFKVWYMTPGEDGRIDSDFATKEEAEKAAELLRKEIGENFPEKTKIWVGDKSQDIPPAKTESRNLSSIEMINEEVARIMGKK